MLLLALVAIVFIELAFVRPRRGGDAQAEDKEQDAGRAHRRASYRQMAAAAATLSDSVPGASGMVMRTSESSWSASVTPLPSPPNSQPRGWLSLASLRFTPSRATVQAM